MTTSTEFLDLIERYRAQLKLTFETGKPWVRPELENIPEGVLI